MTMMQLRKLKRTIKPRIKKTLLKQTVITTRLRMQNKLIDKMAMQAGLMVKDRRKQLSQRSARAFPTKQVLLNHQNQHLANEVGKKLLGMARQKIYSSRQQQMPSDVNSIQALMSDQVFDNVVRKLTPHEKYISPERTKLITKITELKHDLRMMADKVSSQIRKYGPDTPVVLQASMQLAKKYGIAKTFKQIVKLAKQYIPLQMQQIDEQGRDYDVIVFDQSRSMKYPKSFAKKMRGKQLRNLVDKYVGHGGYDIGGVLSECWGQQPQIVDRAINDVVFKYLSPLGVEDQSQIGRIKAVVAQKLKKGE